MTLMNDPAVTSIVCATDAGREGELIFRLLYDYAHCDKLVERLWINSMEDYAIREGFQNLRPAADFDQLYQAALCRSRADWLIGINATRRYGALTHRKGIRIGRVQSPTLAMLVQRQEEIKAFQPSAYFTVELSGNGLKTVSEPIADRAAADALVSACNGQAVVKSVERSRKTVKPPMLYDLTALQRDANRIYGYSALTTSDLAQQLYERKLLTYPRTDSRYITEDMWDSVAELVKTACAALNIPSDFRPDTARIADSSKVSDHYALLPTVNVSRAVLSELDEEKRNLLRLVLLRLVSAVSKPYVYEETTVTLECGGVLFTVQGKSVIEQGWKAYERRDSENSALPSLEEGDIISVSAKRRDHQTKAPSPYTEDTLLAAMEHAASGDFEDGVERSGLGTPATRASIIDKLIVYDYVKRMGRNLIPTERARLLIGMLPDELRSPAMTAQWENELLRIERGEADPAQFMEDIKALTRKIVALEPDVDAVRQLTYFGVDEVGKCPRCGKPVYEQSNSFFCSGSSCSFALWKNSGYLAKAGIRLTRSLAAELIANGQA
ncbi:MAG: DNA topoisomerase III, partial [Oscillospiraceae bacterium]|nr:DNA topoisomerase III [Oscillospiraceae bacterium]